MRAAMGAASGPAGHGGRTDPLNHHGRSFVMLSATSEPHNPNSQQAIGDAVADAI
jgi:hypothetical protein